MKREDFMQLAIGDRIEFRAITRHNTRKQIRKITGWPLDYFAGENLEHTRHPEFVRVRFEGADGFLVRRTEIIRKVD